MVRFLLVVWKPTFFTCFVLSKQLVAFQCEVCFLLCDKPNLKYQSNLETNLSKEISFETYIDKINSTKEPKYCMCSSNYQNKTSFCSLFFFLVGRKSTRTRGKLASFFFSRMLSTQLLIQRRCFLFQLFCNYWLHFFLLLMSNKHPDVAFEGCALS